MSATLQTNHNGGARRIAPWIAILAGLSVGLPGALAQSEGGASLTDFMNKHLSNEAAVPTAASTPGSLAEAGTPSTAPTPSLAAPAPTPAPISGEGEGVNVSEYLTVDIFVQDEDLANVLQMLSLQSQKNIVASRDVAASVSANLYGVTFYEALDAILHVNGYAWYEQGNFIYVVTQAEYQTMQAEARKPIAKMIQLNYLNANDAAEFVTPLLSEVGQIKTNGDMDEFQIPEDTPTGADEFALSATLVVFDYEENVAEIEELLHQLDTRPAQVLVEATILQTALTENTAFGIDFSILADASFVDFLGTGGPLSAANALIGAGGTPVVPVDGRATGITSTVGNTAGAGGFKLGVIHDDIAIFLRALDEVTDVSILSRPKILALNRQPARVLVGRKLGYLNTTSTETSTTQTVEFLDTCTQLAFRPFIANDGMIRLELKPRVSEGVIRTANDATGATVTIPDEITQELTTNIMVNDGSTVVLGGLFKESTTLKRQQVPIVGDIPILGYAFRGYDDSIDRSEIIFMIKPTIMNDRVLLDQSERALATVDRVRTGSRQGLLEFSREKQTSKLNIQAEKFAREGNTEKAVWALSRSLELNPSQPDAIQLREELLNKHEEWPGRSALEEVIRGEFSDRLISLHEVPADSVFVDATETWSDDAFMNEGLEGEPLTDENIIEFTEVPMDEMSDASFEESPLSDESSSEVAEIDWSLFETDIIEDQYDDESMMGSEPSPSESEVAEVHPDQVSSADHDHSHGGSIGASSSIFHTYPFAYWQRSPRPMPWLTTNIAGARPSADSDSTPVASHDGWITVPLEEKESSTQVADVPDSEN